MRTFLAMGIIAVLVSGCASSRNADKQPAAHSNGDAATSAAASFVGKWKAVGLPKDEGSVTMEINADGTFSGVAEDNPPNHFSGKWKQDTAGKAVFTEEGMDKPADARMINANQMILDAHDEDDPVEFNRQP